MRILFIVYDNESYISTFPHGTAALTAVLEQAGHAVELYFQDIYHFSEEHLTRYLDDTKFDMVGLSFIGGYWQYQKALKISVAINKSKNRPGLYVIGGHGSSPEPEFFLHKTEADVACIGEGEETILELADGVPLEKIAGIAWRDDGGSVHVNPRRELIKDIDALPFPAYHRFPMEIYRLLRSPRCSATDFCIPMLSGRGCTFKCNFCYRMDKGFRPRGNEYIIAEIQLLKDRYGATYIAFQDELLVSSIARVESLCNDFLKHDLNVKWNCNGRLNYATPALLQLMKRSGCVFINYGIECFDDEVLKNMNKNLTTAQIIRGVEATLAAGISPGLNMIWGNIGDNKRTLRQSVDFLLKYDDGAQLRTIRPVTPYPGSELYYTAIRMGKLQGCEDFYENKHVNSDLLSVNFTDLTDDEFYDALHEANLCLLENYQQRSEQSTRRALDALYKEKNTSFRGFRHT